MKIVYVLPHASLCGGVKVIAEHVTGLRQRGHDAQVWCLSGDFLWFDKGRVPIVKYRSTDELGAALRSTECKKIATFWTTASWVKDNLKDGEEGYYLIQDEDELTYSNSNSGTSYRLGLKAITESVFVTEEIEIKYGIQCHNVGIGIDPKEFNHLPMLREQFRVLTTARTTSAGPCKLKGFDTAQLAMRELAAIEPKASVVTFSVENRARFSYIPHIHLVRPNNKKIRELYSQSGVFLSCSRHEGFGLPMLEAMACGLPVVCTDSHGNREFCIDGETAIVVERDAKKIANACKMVMNDVELFKRLSSNGLKMAEKYRWSNVIDNLCSVLGV